MAFLSSTFLYTFYKLCNKGKSRAIKNPRRALKKICGERSKCKISIRKSLVKLGLLQSLLVRSGHPCRPVLQPPVACLEKFSLRFSCNLTQSVKHVFLIGGNGRVERCFQIEGNLLNTIHSGHYCVYFIELVYIMEHSLSDIGLVIPLVITILMHRY